MASDQATSTSQAHRAIRRKAAADVTTTTAQDLVTLARLQQFAPNGLLNLLTPIVQNLAILDKYEINTPLRVSHFLGQCAVESWYFTTLNEKGNPERYRGRGYIQLTGLANYRTYGPMAHVDLVSNPDRAAEPDLAVLLACLFWDTNHLNQWANIDDASKVSRAINRGNPDSPSPANNEEERIEWTERAKSIFTTEFDSKKYVADGLRRLGYMPSENNADIDATIRRVANSYALADSEGGRSIVEMIARALLQNANKGDQIEAFDVGLGSTLTFQNVARQRANTSLQSTVTAFAELLRVLNTEAGRNPSFGGIFPEGVGLVTLQVDSQSAMTITVGNTYSQSDR